MFIFNGYLHTLGNEAAAVIGTCAGIVGVVTKE